MCVFGPRPMSSQGIESLAVQEGDDEALQERSKLEFRLKEFILVERTAQTRALVALIKVPVSSRIYSLDTHSW